MRVRRHRDRSSHVFYLVSLATLVALPSASAAEVNEDVFRYGAGIFLFLALLPFLFRLLRLDTRPWSREHRGLPPVGRNEDSSGPDGGGEGEADNPPDNPFHRLSDAVLRPYHPVFGIVGVLTVIIHGVLEWDCGKSTMIAMAVLLGYLLTGGGMRSGAPWIGDVRSNRVFHVSWLVALLLVAIIIGHVLF